MARLDRSEPPDDLTEYGPVIGLVVAPPVEAHSVLGDRIQPQRVEAVLDTGNANTWVDRVVLNKLRLPPNEDELPVTTEVGGSVVTVHHAAMSLTFDDEEYHVPFIDVLSAEMRGLPYQAVIGRDILRKGVFTYDGVRGSYSLTFL